MAQQHSPGFTKLVDEVKTRIKEIQPSELNEKLKRKEKFELVDVREADEYAAGRLPGARHLCKGIIERDIEEAVPDFNAEVVLYCGGGYRSALSADNLQRMGYKNVRSLAGGWRGWNEAKYPVEKP